MNIRIEPATPEMALEIGGNLRDSDIEEVWNSHHLGAVEACVESVEVSDYAFCGLVDDVPIYLFGLNGNTVWGLGTDRLEAHRHRFLRASHNFITFCRGHADYLENWVAADNVNSAAWLEWLGFTMEEAAPYGEEQELFHHFHMKGGFFSNAAAPNQKPKYAKAVEHELPEEISTPEKRREFILNLEDALDGVPGAFHGNNETAPLKHTFANGVYVREIALPSGMLLTGRIHKHEHPNFLLEGAITMVTEDGGLIRMSAPQSLISPAGCKRAIFTHTATRWATVHRTDKTDIEEIEQDITWPNYEALEHHRARQLEIKS